MLSRQACHEFPEVFAVPLVLILPVYMRVKFRKRFREIGFQSPRPLRHLLSGATWFCAYLGGLLVVSWVLVEAVFPGLAPSDFSLLERLNPLVRADGTTRDPKNARTVERRIDELEERIAVLREQEELDSIRPPIDGHAVMTFLGIKPGPLVGEVMDLLLEYRLDEGPYSEEEAYRLVREWAEGRGLNPLPAEPGGG